MQQKTARVAAVHKERFELLCEGQRVYARLKTSIFHGENSPDLPTTGDFVNILYNADGDSQIVETLPRRSFFSRRDADKKRLREQAVAANFDYVFILTSLNRDFNLRRLERYLTLAWESGAQPVVVLTKADLVDDFSEILAAASAVAAGVPVHAVSAVSRFGLEGLAEYIQKGRTIVLLGSSGVGKSSLLNALAGQEIMDVNAIREGDARGRHTTTHRQLIELAGGAFVIDTPGMRELGMWSPGGGVSGVFDDVETLAERCRFRDCRHQAEPGCAVLAAIESGELERERLTSYQKLLREAAYAERRAKLKNK